MPRNRNNHINLRLTLDEFLDLKSKIQKTKMTNQEYLFKCAFDKKIVVIDGIKDFSVQLKKIGTNVNQIAKQVNSGIILDCSSELKIIQEGLDETWQQLKVFLEKHL